MLPNLPPVPVHEIFPDEALGIMPREVRTVQT